MTDKSLEARLAEALLVEMRKDHTACVNGPDRFGETIIDGRFPVEKSLKQALLSARVELRKL